jgi:hypothetical protein
MANIMFEFKNVSPELRGDRDIVLAAVSKHGHNLKYASDELKNDREVVLKAIANDNSKGAIAFKCCSEDVKGDIEVALAALSKNKFNMRYLSHKLKANREFVLRAFASDDDDAFIFRNCSAELRGDRQVVLAAISKNPRNFRYVSHELKNDPQVVIKAILQHVHSSAKAVQFFKSLSPFMRSNREVVIAAVSKNGANFKYASDELKNDRGIVLTAIANDEVDCGCVYKMCPLAVKNDREIVLAAVSKHGKDLVYVSDEFRHDREVVLRAVANDESETGVALRCASIDLRGDREIVLAAVSKHGHSLQYASKELKNDREIGLRAMANDRSNRQYYTFLQCSKELRANREFALVGVTKCGRSLRFVSDELKNDREIVLTAIANDDTQFGVAFDTCSLRLRQDPDFVLEALMLSVNTKCLAQIPDPDVVLKCQGKVHELLSSHDSYKHGFLYSWPCGQRNYSSGANKKAYNTLSMLSLGLGKYGSLTVKKLIADYLGLYYGKKYVMLKVAQKNIITKST